jgi:predicted transcriptional regulator
LAKSYASRSISLAPDRVGLGRRGGATTTRDNRRYRTKIEVLRDLLEAASRERRKTRIIGTANLNQESFQRYAGLAMGAGLLQVTNGMYFLTPAAKDWLRAVDGVLRKGTEVSVALAGLSRLTRRPTERRTSPPVDMGELARQLVARLAWSELGVREPMAEEPIRPPASPPRPGTSVARELVARVDPVRSMLPAIAPRRPR